MVVKNSKKLASPDSHRSPIDGGDRSETPPELSKYLKMVKKGKKSSPAKSLKSPNQKPHDIYKDISSY